jgi:hypothetical protein
MRPSFWILLAGFLVPGLAAAADDEYLRRLHVPWTGGGSAKTTVTADLAFNAPPRPR